MLRKLKENKLLVVISAIAIMTFAMSAMCFATDSAPDYSTLISQLNTGLGGNAFIGVIGDVLPYIITVTIVSLVWYLVRRAIKKFAKGKPGV